jgi:hypothetical protein
MAQSRAEPMRDGILCCMSLSRNDQQEIDVRKLSKTLMHSGDLALLYVFDSPLLQDDPCPRSLHVETPDYVPRFVEEVSKRLLLLLWVVVSRVGL